MKKEVAFSGLEAAIVLIAFVVVAAVFSYVMLGAGFFATQKSQEVTYSGIKQATSNLVLDGQIYGTKDATGAAGKLNSLTLTLAIPEGGQSQNLGMLTFIWTQTGALQPATITPNPAVNTILSPGDKQEIAFIIANGPIPGQSFTLEIKPLTGASTLISKTLVTGYEGGPII